MNAPFLIKVEKIYNCPRRLFETLRYDEQKYFKLPIKIVFFSFFLQSPDLHLIETSEEEEKR